MSAALAYVPPEAYQAANDNDHVSDGVVIHLHKTRHCRGLLQLDLIHWIKSPGFARPFPKHLGSAQTGTSQNGTVAWRQQHAPFGEELNTLPVNNDLAGYTGHIKDSATGLNYMQARYYDPLIGRFLSIDPINFSPDAPYMFNRFTYVGNDPINLTDPFGMQAMTEEQRNLASQGKVDEFWESRVESGDPIAEMGVEFGKPPSEQSPGVYQSAGVLKNKIFEKITSEKTPSEVPNIDQAIASEVGEIRQDLMKAHIRAVDEDREGQKNFLSAEQITDYHQQVFANNGLPPDTFGGSQLTGTKLEGKITGALIWCKTCDKK